MSTPAAERGPETPVKPMIRVTQAEAVENHLVIEVSKQNLYHECRNKNRLQNMSSEPVNSGIALHRKAGVDHQQSHLHWIDSSCNQWLVSSMISKSINSFLGIPMCRRQILRLVGKLGTTWSSGGDAKIALEAGIEWCSATFLSPSIVLWRPIIDHFFYECQLALSKTMRLWKTLYQSTVCDPLQVSAHQKRLYRQPITFS